ncbi:MAG: ATP-grasp domain-containing protein, partial [Candidatus Eremiobacteraeota bacterium]|nr:ATP-grasp domain-containing protein [Candidatus Eremiobacteraeota bacterium]
EDPSARTVVIDEAILAQIDRIPSKAEFLSAALAAGIRAPETSIAAGPADARILGERLGYPLVAKAAHGHGGMGIERVDDPSSFERFGDDAWPQILQPLIEGVPATTEVLFVRGEPVRWFTSEMRDCWPSRFSPSSSRRVVDHPEVADFLQRIGTLTQFDGLAGIDWLIAEDGRLFLIEMNYRPTTCYDLTPQIRAAFVRALAQAARGEAIEPRGAIAAELGKQYPQFPQYLYFAAFEPGLPLHRRVGGMLRTFSRADWRDPRLVLTHLEDFALACYNKSRLPHVAHALKSAIVGRRARSDRTQSQARSSQS